MTGCRREKRRVRGPIDGFRALAAFAGPAAEGIERAGAPRAARRLDRATNRIITSDDHGASEARRTLGGA